MSHTKQILSPNSKNFLLRLVRTSICRVLIYGGMRRLFFRGQPMWEQNYGEHLFQRFVA